jgi:hypothetical protein
MLLLLLKWQKMIKQFYTPFHKTVSKTELVERSSVQNRSKELGDFSNKTGKQRGTLDGNDDYATFQFQISWLFLNSICKN